MRLEVAANLCLEKDHSFNPQKKFGREDTPWLLTVIPYLTPTKNDEYSFLLHLFCCHALTQAEKRVKSQENAQHGR